MRFNGFDFSVSNLDNLEFIQAIRINFTPHNQIICRPLKSSKLLEEIIALTAKNWLSKEEDTVLYHDINAAYKK